MQATRQQLNSCVISKCLYCVAIERMHQSSSRLPSPSGVQHAAAGSRQQLCHLPNHLPSFSDCPPSSHHHHHQCEHDTSHAFMSCCAMQALTSCSSSPTETSAAWCQQKGSLCPSRHASSLLLWVELLKSGSSRYLSLLSPHKYLDCIRITLWVVLGVQFGPCK